MVICKKKYETKHPTRMLFIFTKKDEQRFHRNFTESINHMELNPRPEKIKALLKSHYKNTISCKINLF